MATNFKVWVESPDATSSTPNVSSDEAFANDTSRMTGWKAGDSISSMKMNSILRQNSLIAVALVEAFLSNTTLGMLSSVEEMKTEMLAAIAMKSDVISLQLSYEGLANSMSSLESSVESVTSTVNRITSGSTNVENSNKLGGNPASYYQKKITFGTSDPTGGVDGDIYIKHS